MTLWRVHGKEDHKGAGQRSGDVKEAVAILNERDRGRTDGVLVCAAVRSSSLLTLCFCAPRAQALKTPLFQSGANAP